MRKFAYSIKFTAQCVVIVAWRVQWLMRLGRTCPEMNCETVFDRKEWQAAYIVAKTPIPPKPPLLNTVIRLIATFGGFLARKGDGEPGVKTIGRNYSE